MKRSAPNMVSASLAIIVLIRLKLEAAKIKKLRASVNMMLVLLFLFLCPSKFLLMRISKRRSRRQQLCIIIQRSSLSTYSKIRIEINVIPRMINKSRRSKIKKNHCIL